MWVYTSVTKNNNYTERHLSKLGQIKIISSTNHTETNSNKYSEELKKTSTEINVLSTDRIHPGCGK